MGVHSNAAAVPTGNGVPEDPFPTGDDGNGVSLEWLSAFVEECLNGGGFACQQTPIPPPPPPQSSSSSSKSTRATVRAISSESEGGSLESESPLVPQAYWLAESELILIPQRKDEEEEEEERRRRRCTHCLSQKTPQWRAGPMGPKTLCNACGVRFRSGRLLPEYRPAKSPTFKSYKHSNSHKKIMEMRLMAALTTTSSSSSPAN